MHQSGIIHTQKPTTQYERVVEYNDLFQLDQSDKAILLTPTAWLTDRIIDASQKLLLQKMPGNAGFQSVTLGRTLHFEVQSNKYVQILHNGHGYWLTISTVGVTHPEVSVYAIMYPTRSMHVKSQIASLLATSRKEIRLRHMDVQMQSTVVYLQLPSLQHSSMENSLGASCLTKTK